MSSVMELKSANFGIYQFIQGRIQLDVDYSLSLEARLERFRQVEGSSVIAFKNTIYKYKLQSRTDSETLNVAIFNFKKYI